MVTKITVQEAAKILRMSEQRIRTLCRTGCLEARKFG